MVPLLTTITRDIREKERLRWEFVITTEDRYRMCATMTEDHRIFVTTTDPLCHRCATTREGLPRAFEIMTEALPQSAIMTEDLLQRCVNMEEIHLEGSASTTEDHLC